MVKIFKVKEKYSDITGSKANEFGRDLNYLEKNVAGDLKLDLEGINNISSIGMGTLFATYKKMQDDGRKLSVVNAGDRNKHMLQMLNMSQVLEEEGK